MNKMAAAAAGNHIYTSAVGAVRIRSFLAFGE